MTGLIRVIIADDQEVVRSGFAALLDTRDDITVVGTARDGADAVTVASTNRPDVILMDVRMPVARRHRGDEADHDRRLHADAARDRAHDVRPRRVRLRRPVAPAPAASSSKDVTAETLFDAVRVVAAGDALLAPQRHPPADRASSRSMPGARHGRRRSRRTSRRASIDGAQRLVAAGRSNAEIADGAVRQQRDGQDPRSAGSSASSTPATAPKP